MSDIQNLTETVRFGLENLNLLSSGCKSVRVIKVYLINVDTICCDFYSETNNSIDIKTEIGSVMGFLYGLIEKDGFENFRFNYYCVRAFNSNKLELVNAISSKQALEYIGTGNSIEWLKSTLFQENTDDYRLAQAKKIISEIENCLRELVHLKLNEKFGNNWWDECLNNKLGKDVKQTYFNQFGVECNDGKVLVSYTFTLQLKKIISTHFNLFKSYFIKVESFNSKMDRLNELRREEAHNRSISGDYLQELRELHETLISTVVSEITSFQSVYLTENWRSKIKKVMLETPYSPIHHLVETQNETDLSVKKQKIIENISHLIQHLDETIIKLSSIVTPIHKRTTHQELIEVLVIQKTLQSELLSKSTQLNELDIRITTAKIDEHKKVLDNFIGRFLLSEN